MSEPTFLQPERRSFAVPILLAGIVFVGALFAARHFLPSGSVTVQHVHTAILTETTVYKSNSIVVGPPETAQTFLVASTIKVENHLSSPLTLDDFTLTLTDITGAQLTAKALTKAELANSELSFPALKTLVATPLPRDTVVEPNQSNQGTVVFSLSIPEDTWKSRASATLQIDLYHQPSTTLTIPK